MINLIVEYKDIFDDSSDDIYSYLEGIDKWILIKGAIYFCSLSTKLKPELNNLFYPFLNEGDRGTEFEKLLKTKIVEYIKKHEGVTPVILNVRTSLKFFELIQNFASKKKFELSEGDINKRLLKAYLLLNQNYNWEFESRESLTEMIVANSLIQMIYSEINCIYLRIAELIKSCLFLEYCKLNLSEHYLRFLKEYGVSDWQEYVTYVHQIGMLILKEEMGSIPIISIPKNDKIYEKKVMFFDKFCLSEVYKNDEDYTKIKARPVIKNSKTEEYYIIFEQFFLEKMYKSLYFTFNLINSELKGKTGYVKNFRSDIGKYFSEKILLNKIIVDALGKKYKHLGYNELLGEGRPDYYIRDGKNVFLFECKDNLIKRSVIESADIELFLNELKSIFVESKEGNRKAIKQLTSNIQDIRKGCFNEDKGLKPLKNIIYPIIITNNTIFSLPGVNLLVDEWFKKELEDNKLNSEGIKNITLININTLIIIQGLLRNNSFNMKMLIEDYWSEFNLFKKKKFPTEEAFIYERYKASISFDKFIEDRITNMNIFTNEINEYNKYFEKK